MLAGLFSDRPFGTYLFRTFIGIGIVSGSVGLLLGKGLYLLLMMLLCTLACKLSYKLYQKMQARKQKEQQVELTPG